ncbi:MAG: WbuC family cupin fold metalloprotein, partial [Cyanobium sp.]
MTSPQLKCLDQALFDAVAAEARSSTRLRCNHNLHAEPELVQRFLNVMQPGTYVRPHRHLRCSPGEGFECFLVLQGAMGVLLLDSEGALIQQLRDKLGDAFADENEEISLLELVKRLITYRPVLVNAFALQERPGEV